MDITKFVDGLIPWIKREISPLFDRIVALEAREFRDGKDGVNGKDGIDGKDGADGKDADPEQIKALISEQIAQIPPPKDGKDADFDQIKAFIVDEIAKIEPRAGANGKDGADGKSIDPEEVKTLIADIVGIAFEQLPKPKDGKDGADGKNIPPEDVQKMVDDAVSKAISAIKPPENGRDALHLEILPSIDESKSFPRGTYALHRKGLWRSFQATSGMKGWECIVAGVFDISATRDGETFKITSELSDGKSFTEEFHVAMMCYKGIFKHGETYKPGNTATFGGSLWHCNSETKEKPGEGCADWTLCAKKGRDGK